MHVFLVTLLLLAPGFSMIGAMLLAVYGMFGGKPGRGYAAGSILCAIAAPVLWALDMTVMVPGSSMWFAENLRVSAWFFGPIYVGIGVPLCIVYPWDRYNFYPQPIPNRNF